MNTKGTLIAAMAAGLLTAGASPLVSAGDKAETGGAMGDKHACKGKDGCKGKEAGDKHACKGKDGCKGKEAGDKHACKGKDGCKAADPKQKS